MQYFQAFYADYYFPLNLILYDDGLMLTNGMQKILSADEIKMFFAKLDSLGFFSLKSNQRHDEEDKLYNFGNHYEQIVDGSKFCITADYDESKTLCAYEPYMQFLIPEMKNILNYYDEYKPDGLTPYYPDRILLSTRVAKYGTDNLSVKGTLWDEHFPSLDYSPGNLRDYDDFSVSIRYIQGEMANEIYQFVLNSHSNNIFIQNGNNYFVLVNVVLPHETVINAYQ